MLTGSAGTERSLREQGQHRSILHIATHGFYLETCLREAQQQGRPLEPMDVSGVALAGASQHASRPAEDDGLFTAADFATLDLRGTQLVVLSACDTATGAVVEGQGAQGLQQAVLTAGVPSMVMSLWKVPDEDTRALMDQFYQGVVSGLGPREALQRAQLHALAVQRATGAGDAIGRFGAFIYTGQ
jgi:CHAT domain-containing protein